MLDPTRLRLRGFYANVLNPIVHADASFRTVKEYMTTLRHWEAYSRDLPLAEIDSVELARWRSELTRHMAPATVNKHLRQINHLLAKAGPPGPHNRDALALLPTAPWAKPLKTYRLLPKLVQFETIDRVYAKAGTYFRAFLACAYNLGSRFEALIHLAEGDVDFAARRASFKAQHDKRRIERVKPINATVLRHLTPLRGEGLLNWTSSRSTWRRRWAELQDAASLTDEERFTPHDLKRTCGTMLGRAGADVWQRRYMLDHAQQDVTGEHYIDPLERLDEIVERMPQPKSFTRKFNERHPTHA